MQLRSLFLYRSHRLASRDQSTFSSSEPSYSLHHHRSQRRHWYTTAQDGSSTNGVSRLNNACQRLFGAQHPLAPPRCSRRPRCFCCMFFTRGLAFKDEITNTMAVIIKVCFPTPSTFSLDISSLSFLEVDNVLTSFVLVSSLCSQLYATLALSLSIICLLLYTLPTIFRVKEPAPSCCFSTTVLPHRCCSTLSRLSTSLSQRCSQSKVLGWRRLQV